MAEHFKLIISPRYTQVVTFTGVEEDFAEEYANTLSYGRMNNIKNKSDENSDGSNDSSESSIDEVSSSNEVLKSSIDEISGSNESLKSSIDEFNRLMNIILQVDDKEREASHSYPPVKPKKKQPKKSAYNEPDPDTYEGRYSLYNYRKRIKERSAKFRAYAFINFAKMSTHFATLTFNPATFSGADDLDTAHEAFRKFVKRVQGKYTDFKYAGTFSRQKNGNWHYHMLFNFDATVTTKDIEDMWQYGFVSSTFITSGDELNTKISYCIDNMFKVSYSDLKGEKGYLHSKNLQTQLVLRSWNKKEADKAYELLNKLLQKGIDKPSPKHSVMLEKGKSFFSRFSSPTGEPVEVKDDDKQINYLYSSKGFPELFDKPIVAKRKSLKRDLKE